MRCASVTEAAIDAMSLAAIEQVRRDTLCQHGRRLVALDQAALRVLAARQTCAGRRHRRQSGRSVRVATTRGRRRRVLRFRTAKAGRRRLECNAAACCPAVSRYKIWRRKIKEWKQRYPPAARVKDEASPATRPARPNGEAAAGKSQQGLKMMADPARVNALRPDGAGARS